MSRPLPLPPAGDHERHDSLLVAQLAAGDPISDAQRAEAQRLVSTCGACAQLAADLRGVAAAVAWEPLPPRRRDFRIDPEQAERLRGNAITRALRRLALPQSRAFRPAAAGVLTAGLVFVVAGYAWPDGGEVTVTLENAPVPAANVEMTPLPAVLEEQPVVLEEQPGAPDGQAAAPDDQASASELRAAAPAQADVNAFEEPATEAAEAERLLEGDAVASAPQKSLAQRAPSDDDLMDEAGAAAGAVTADELEVAQVTGVEAADEVEAAEGTRVAGNAEVAGVAEPPDAAEPVDAAAAGSTADAAADTMVAAAPDGWGSALASLLIVGGLAMTLAGGVALALAWIARRTRDPLLR